MKIQVRTPDGRTVTASSIEEARALGTGKAAISAAGNASSAPTFQADALTDVRRRLGDLERRVNDQPSIDSWQDVLHRILRLEEVVKQVLKRLGIADIPSNQPLPLSLPAKDSSAPRLWREAPFDVPAPKGSTTPIEVEVQA